MLWDYVSMEPLLSKIDIDGGNKAGINTGQVVGFLIGFLLGLLASLLTHWVVNLLTPASGVVIQ